MCKSKFTINIVTIYIVIVANCALIFRNIPCSDATGFVGKFLMYVYGLNVPVFTERRLFLYNYKLDIVKHENDALNPDEYKVLAHANNSYLTQKYKTKLPES